MVQRVIAQARPTLARPTLARPTRACRGQAGQARRGQACLWQDGLQAINRQARPRPAYHQCRRDGRTGAGPQRTQTGVALTETTDVTLAALMAAAQNGDARAYTALLRACVPYAAAAARRQGIASERIDDVVQDVLLTVHRARATYDPRRPFLPWLRAIASRRAIDSLRQRYRNVSEVQDEDAAAAAASQAPDAGDRLAEADQNRILAEAIGALPPGQRQAVELLALQERSLDQASQQTGRSKVALKVNLHRAIHALRKTLAQSPPDPGPGSSPRPGSGYSPGGKRLTRDV